jgi:anti-sigma factor RsiW
MDDMPPEIRHPDEDLLVDYADGLLNPDESLQVAGHLLGCSDCQRKLKALQDSLALTQAIWQGNLAEIEDVQFPITSRFPWKRIQALAACILLGIGLFWASHRQTTSNDAILPVPNLEQIERDIAQATMAAKLLAAADLMAKYPDARMLVQSQYRHIVEGYPHTNAALNAQLLIE